VAEPDPSASVPAAAGGPLFLDDLQVGHRFVSRAHVLERTEILRFAAEFDPQPFHLDDEAARHSLFGGLVASGWHTAAISMRLIVEAGAPFAGGIVGLGGEIVWPKPVYPGDTLQVHGEVLAIAPSRSRPDRGVVSIRNETRNGQGEVVQVFTARILVNRRPSPAG
jgi:acyl dehydratase